MQVFGSVCVPKQSEQLGCETCAGGIWRENGIKVM